MPTLHRQPTRAGSVPRSDSEALRWSAVAWAAVNEEPPVRYRTIHGHRRAYRLMGEGPPLLLLHGIGDSSASWLPVMAALAEHHTVIAPDLLGHGNSAKPRADYSVAAYANGMRDLLSVLDVEKVTVVGHSLGGGVAMQFAYQFPQLVERLILVGAGGVTKDVNIALRLASLPLGGEALALLRLPMVLPALQVAGRALGTAGPWFPEGWPEPEIAWTLWDAEAEGKGYATEAALATRAYAYDTLGWTTAISLILDGNDRSAALAARLGCVREGGFTHAQFGATSIWRHPAPDAQGAGMEAYA